MGLRRTPLYEAHKSHGGRMVEFGGFEMPVQYKGIKEEHAAVRERAGLFDVSHMGQVYFSGPAAVETVEKLVTCPVASLKVGGVRYGMLCNDRGGVVDDVTVYRIADDLLFLCVNASNIEKDVKWIQQHSPPEAGVVDRSAETAMLAVQGPNSTAILESVDAEGVADIGRFSFAPIVISGIQALISSTGYTGSAGYEIYLGAGDVQRLFEELIEAGAVPCGLGARDTLRLEAALPLYGHELNDKTSPLEAGLGRFVKRDEGGFIGHEAIEKRAAEGHARQLIGFEVEGRGIARADYPILADGEEIGIVTSGAPSPTLGKAIGLGYVKRAFSEVGTKIEIEVRGKGIDANVVKTPFVTARKKAKRKS